ALLNAAKASTDSPALADREQRAGDALRYPSYSPTAMAMQNLADTVNQASQSVLTQRQLSEAYKQLQDAQLRAQQTGSPPPDGATVAQLNGDSGPSQAAAGGPSGQTDKAAAGQGNTSAGFEPGAATRLNVAGVPVEVPIQLSQGPSRLAQL